MGGIVRRKTILEIKKYDVVENQFPPISGRDTVQKRRWALLHNAHTEKYKVFHKLECDVYRKIFLDW